MNRTLSVPGFPVMVFPDPDNPKKHIKKPLVKWADPKNRKKEWNGDWPEGANAVGVVPADLGYLAIDTDAYKGIDLGFLTDLMLYDTRVHYTISGGEHHIYLLKPGEAFNNSRGALPEHVDIRCAGGWVVWPEPGLSAGYTVKHDCEPTERPEWIVDMLRQCAIETQHVNRPGAATLIQITECLLWINPSCAYDEWIRVIGAIKGADGSVWLADQWSAGEFWTGDPPANYPGTDAVREKWDSLDGKAGYGTLLYLAYEGGKPSLNTPTGKEDPAERFGEILPPIKAKVRLQQGRFQDIQKIEWVWNEWLAAGKYHVLAGPKGAGKSTIAYSLMATVSIGGKWPDGSQAEAGDALVWSAEDDFYDTILPRFIAAGGDPDRLYNIATTYDELTEKPRPFDPRQDIGRLSQTIQNLDAKILVIDPIVMAVAGDSHKNAETRIGLHPLVMLAERHRLALIGITHFSKGTEGKDPVERVTGSLAFGAMARVVLAAQSNEEGTERRLVRAASNIGGSGGGFEYVLRQAWIEDGGMWAQEIEWGKELRGSARQLLEQFRNAGPRGKAKKWLMSMLVDGGVDVKEIRAAAQANGYSWPTVERAKAELPQIEAKRRPELNWGRNAPWFWAIRPSD